MDVPSEVRAYMTRVRPMTRDVGLLALLDFTERLIGEVDRLKSRTVEATPQVVDRAKLRAQARARMRRYRARKKAGGKE